MMENASEDGSASSISTSGEPPIVEERGEVASSREHGMGSGDLPLSGESGFMVVESENHSKRKKRIFILSIVGVFVILLIAVIVLAVMLGKDSSVSDSSKAINNAPSTDTDTPLTKIDQVRGYVVSEKYSTSKDVYEEGTPQDLAAQFMALDDNAVPHETSTTSEKFQWKDRYVMTLFYYAMGGENWRVSFDFANRNEETCDWGMSFVRFREGISCNKNGRVTQIILDQNQLKGNLPTEVGLLDSLQVLSAAGNSISGSIPNQIGTLFSIRFLHLFENELTGTIPKTFMFLQNLEDLSLEDNMLTGDLTSIKDMGRLKYLFLEGNGFSQHVDSTFLANLPSLQIIDLSENSFHGNVPAHLFSGGSLGVFDMHRNSLTSFPDVVPEDTTVRFLALQFNPLSGPFPASTISRLENLEHLDLTSTKFEGTMPEEIASLKKLDYLFLADTSFTPGPIPDSFKNLTALVDLSLKHSSRTGMIPSWIGNLNGLVLLDLDSNELTGGVPREIGNMTELAFLFLHRNRLVGTVPEEVGMAKRLSYVFLDHNSLSGNLDVMCNTPPLKRVTSDCGSPSNEITCTCCRVCCDDNNVTAECTEHNQNDFLMMLDPNWSTRYDRYDPWSGRHVYVYRDFNITG